MANQESGMDAGAETINHDALIAPIPDLTTLRQLKDGYREYPIDLGNPQSHEELIDISAYDLPGQSYYSRPNAATGEPVAEVPKTLYLRKSIAEKLLAINQTLTDPALTRFFGGPVELYVEDAHRSYLLQKQLYEKVFPHLIRQQHPGLSDEELADQLQNLIAEPSDDPARPFPHATGGAADVILRYKQKTPGFVDKPVFVAHLDGDTSSKIELDYFEHHEPKDGHEKFAQRNRRAFYAIMTGAAFNQQTELQVNPTEWFHWSWGDQMWAKLQNKPAALYGLAEKP
jgi:D-alanyl-D-alanine dipeptidase